MVTAKWLVLRLRTAFSDRVEHSFDELLLLVDAEVFIKPPEPQLPCARSRRKHAMRHSGDAPTRSRSSPMDQSAPPEAPLPPIATAALA